MGLGFGSRVRLNELDLDCHVDVLCRQCSWFGPDCNQIKGGSSKVGKLFVLSAKVGIGQSFKGLSKNSLSPLPSNRSKRAVSMKSVHRMCCWSKQTNKVHCRVISEVC